MSYILFKLDKDDSKLYFEQVSGNQVRLSNNILRASQYDNKDSAKEVKKYLEKTFNVNFDDIEWFEFNYGSNLTENQKILITRLRKETGSGMMECKTALTNTDWDYSAAKNYLREPMHSIGYLDRNKNW